MQSILCRKVSQRRTILRADRIVLQRAGGDDMTQDQLDRMNKERLLKEYSIGMKHCFNDMFGHNARLEQNMIAKELKNRGILELPNIFGYIEICDTW